MSNEEDDCLKQLETIKEDFVKTVSVSDASLNTTTDVGGIRNTHVIHCCVMECTC